MKALMQHVGIYPRFRLVTLSHFSFKALGSF